MNRGLTDTTNRYTLKKNMLTPLSNTLLALIHRQPQSGYQLAKSFRSTPMGLQTDCYGSIYPALKKLERAGYIEGHIDQSVALRPKVVYRATQRAVQALEKWVNVLPTRREIQRNHHALLVRFSFIEAFAGLDQTLRFLTAYRDELREMTEGLKSFQSQEGEKLRTNSRLALELGVKLSDVQLAWAESALQRLKRSKTA